MFRLVQVFSLAGFLHEYYYDPGYFSNMEHTKYHMKIPSNV